MAATTNDVYRKIKEISLRSAKPRPDVEIRMLANELTSPQEPLINSLKELAQMRLILMDQPGTVKLTLLGTTVKR